MSCIYLQYYILLHIVFACMHVCVSVCTCVFKRISVLYYKDNEITKDETWDAECLYTFCSRSFALVF